MSQATCSAASCVDGSCPYASVTDTIYTVSLTGGRCISPGSRFRIPAGCSAILMVTSSCTPSATPSLVRLGAGDIGEHFPDSDPRYRGIASSELLQQVVIRMRQQGWRVENIDVTICAEQPKLAPHRPMMRARVADLAGVAPDRVNIKAKTNEGLDAVGRGEAIAATAVVAIEKM